MKTPALFQTSPPAKSVSNVKTAHGNATASNRELFAQQGKPPIEDDSRLGAHDLFSSFTADIIKANTLFTR